MSDKSICPELGIALALSCDPHLIEEKLTSLPCLQQTSTNIRLSALNPDAAARLLHSSQCHLS